MTDRQLEKISLIFLLAILCTEWCSHFSREQCLVYSNGGISPPLSLVLECRGLIIIVQRGLLSSGFYEFDHIRTSKGDDESPNTFFFCDYACLPFSWKLSSFLRDGATDLRSPLEAIFVCFFSSLGLVFSRLFQAVLFQAVLLQYRIQV